MVRVSIIASLAFAAFAAAQAGDGSQFITGPCVADADCASGCCSIDTEACAARLVAEEGSGCGFQGAGGAANNNNDAAAGAEEEDAGAAAGTGDQFITGPCTSDADCASGCCSIDTEACAARLVAEEGSGCGFEGGAAKKLRRSVTPPSAKKYKLLRSRQDEAEAANGAGDGSQFITGPCSSDADCASGCCSIDTEACAAEAVAEEGSGCGFVAGGAANNNNNAAADEEDAAAADEDAAAAGTGDQFITGPCTSDADCASGCCSIDTEACAARLVAEEGSGCGFQG